MNLVQHAFNEFLATKTRIHSHNKHHIHIGKQFLNKCQRSTRVDSNTCLAACGLYLLDNAMGMRSSFDVEGDYISPCFGKGFNLILGMLNHQMHIEDRSLTTGLLDCLAQALHHR